MDQPQLGDVETAGRMLGRLRLWFDRGVAALAAHCALDGQLQSVRLNQHQLPSFEIAWASADLLAAETVLAGLNHESSELDASLALIFSVDAVSAVLSRLECLYLELELDLAPLQALAALPAWARLRRSATGADALVAAGRALAKSDREVGRVALD